MQLRNKETREIGRIAKTNTNDEEIEIITDTKVYLYKFISDVYRHWEDYEEPKEYWFIDTVLNKVRPIADKSDEEWIKFESWSKQIGNYFETKEEAEKAVEKLKAWKRLKDKGFTFIDGWLDNNNDFIIKAKLGTVGLIDQPDVHLLFGRSEE